jgi:hypothetical protein
MYFQRLLSPPLGIQPEGPVGVFRTIGPDGRSGTVGCGLGVAWVSTNGVASGSITTGPRGSPQPPSTNTLGQKSQNRPQLILVDPPRVDPDRQ